MVINSRNTRLYLASKILLVRQALVGSWVAEEWSVWYTKSLTCIKLLICLVGIVFLNTLQTRMAKPVYLDFYYL